MRRICTLIISGLACVWAQNVGIGTATPQNRLHVDGPPPSDATGGQLRISESTNSRYLLIGRSGDYGFVQTHNNQPLLLNPLGNNVGINTTAPDGRLGIREGWGNWIGLRDGINNNLYVFHNPGSGDRLEVGVFDAATNTWRWQVMGIRPVGNVGIGTALPNDRAILEINSTNRGLLIPRLTTTQRDAIPDPIPQGLIIYNTNTNCIEFFDTSADPPGGPTGGFWNSLCQYCDYTVSVTSSQTGFSLQTHIVNAGIPLGPYTYCVYVYAGVTLQAASNGGGAGAAGNPGFNAFTMPNGAKVLLFNYGTILAGGGNGGQGGQESDGVCSGDQDGGAGGRGGDAVLTNSSVPILVYNYGILRAGGGGGGGGRGGCCSAGGGGGGGAGTPPGSGGPGNSWRCVGGTICTCGGGGRSGSSGGGAGGTATAGGAGAPGGSTVGTGCPGTGAIAGSRGGDGGTNGAAGQNGGTENGCCGSGCTAGPGGGPGYAINGNGSGSRLIVNTGTVVGAVIP
ncbi:MAG: hypothetical protein N2170_07505 [Bacteroidia bacterium]|nr:hypothetical protein [Bacteroidia bacterium]